MKKYISAAAVTLCLSMGVQPAAAEELFDDVKENYGFYNEVEYLFDKGIINGFPDGTFRPETAITRAQAAIMLGKKLGYDGEKQGTTFSDVDSSSVASGYIAEAVENGIIAGYPDGTYKPGKLVSRGDMAILLARTYELELLNNHNVEFVDISENMAAYEAISKISQNYITQGYNVGGYTYEFRPNQPLKRGEFSAMMARADFPEVFAVSHYGQIVEILDVGTSDAILFKYPNNETLLIDTGSDPELLQSALDDLLYFKGNIDTLLLTHPDPDHIGNAAYVLENYDVKRVIDNGQQVDTPEYIAYQEALENSDAVYQKAKVGDNYSAWDATTVEVLHTDDQSQNIDEGSIVLNINRYKNDFLLMSDAGPETEAELLASGRNLEADVLILSDNFGYNAGSQEFIDAVNPKDAFFSWSATEDDLPPDIFKTLGSRFTMTTVTGSIRILESRGLDYMVWE